MPNSHRCGKETANEHHRNPESNVYRVVEDTEDHVILSDYISFFKDLVALEI